MARDWRGLCPAVDCSGLMMIIIISAERRPLLDIGLPQSSPRRSVLCCLHPATSRELHQIVGPPCAGPTNAASPGTRSSFEDLSAPTAVSPPRNVPCPLPLEVCNRRAMSVTLVHLRISSFLIRSRKETPSSFSLMLMMMYYLKVKYKIKYIHIHTYHSRCSRMGSRDISDIPTSLLYNI
jgi:hypothetical protein